MFRKYLLYVFSISMLFTVGECALPQPGPPILSCTLGAANSGSPQTIKVTRPNMGNVTFWYVNYFNKSNNIANKTTNMSYSGVPDFDIYVSDNSVIEVSIVFIETIYPLEESPQSPTATITIGDRTPPTVNSMSPAAGAIDVARNAQISIIWRDTDITLRGVSYNASVVTINGGSPLNMLTNGSRLSTSNVAGQTNTVQGTWTYNPTGQKYNQLVTVSIHLQDHAGNFMHNPNGTPRIETYTYKTVMTAPDAPTVVWNPSVLNGGNIQQFTVTRPSTTNAGANVGIDNITQYNMRWRYQYTDSWTDIYNIAITSDQQVSGVSDNCIVEVQVAFVGSPSPSDWSSSSTVTIGDRTAPSVDSYQISNNGGAAWQSIVTGTVEPAPIRIAWSDKDIDGNGVSWNMSSVTTAC